MFNDHVLNLVNTNFKHVQGIIWTEILLDEISLKVDYRPNEPLSVHDELLRDGISPPAGWDQPGPSWYNFCQFICMAINELLNQ